MRVLSNKPSFLIPSIFFSTIISKIVWHTFQITLQLGYSTILYVPMTHFQNINSILNDFFLFFLFFPFLWSFDVFGIFYSVNQLFIKSKQSKICHSIVSGRNGSSPSSLVSSLNCILNITLKRIKQKWMREMKMYFLKDVYSLKTFEVLWLLLRLG